MAVALGKKRQTQSDTAGQRGNRSNKRRKVAASSQEQSHVPAAKHVRLDELSWNEVELPDRLDDFEGFYGLEEIDDVDVVRDTSGRISFKRNKSPQDNHSENGGPVQEATNNQVPEVAGEVEWEGFDDGVETQEPLLQAAVADGDDLKPRSKEPAREQKKETEKKKQKQKQKKAGSEKAAKSVDTFSAFEQLEDEAADEDFDVSAWGPLQLSPETLSSLRHLKFSKPTPIQAASIPLAVAGHDVVGKAVTGSGKTLAYGIPILEGFLEQGEATTSKANDDRVPLALILSPTRELAHQITGHMAALFTGGALEGPRIATITGGLSLQKQQRLLGKADVIIGTPGRLWEVISNGQGLLDRLKRIRYLVVDEADRLLSEGHYKEVEEILNVLDRQDDEVIEDEETKPTETDDSGRQTLVFSATFSKELQTKLVGKAKAAHASMSKEESIAYLLQKLKFREERPKFVDVNPVEQMAEGLKEGIIECLGTEKDLYLYATLLHHPGQRTLVFANSISAVRRLTPLLQNLGLSVLALHSHMPQKARLRSVEKFTSQKGSMLVATDVAARGLDLPAISLIVHYHLPRTADTYVHRSGRTARAQATGSSILLCGPEETAGVRRLVAKVHAKAATKQNGAGYYIRSLDIDRRIVARLKPRLTLAKALADTTIAKEKKNNDDDLFRQAAEELGADYDSEEFEAAAIGKRGRGNNRIKTERKARATSKNEVQQMRAELKALLSEKINVGVSTRYLTSGGLDIDELLKGSTNADFLGHVQGLGLED